MNSVYHWVGFVVFWCAAYALASIVTFFAFYALMEFLLAPKLVMRYRLESDERISPFTEVLTDVVIGLTWCPGRVALVLFSGPFAIIGGTETLIRLPFLEYRLWRAKHTIAPHAPAPNAPAS